jgi:hypothetical protein
MKTTPPNQQRAAAPLGSPPSLKLRRTGWMVQVIEASQARHNMVSLSYDFHFANCGVRDCCSRPGVFHPPQ